jgi:NDP-sugar pyrophosphorylase family protein
MRSKTPTRRVALDRLHRTAVVLVGGLGTRLGNVARGLPKPMVPVAGKPFLAYLVLQLRDTGFDRIVLASGYGADAVREHFGDGARWGISIAYSIEPRPLGTAGALRSAAELIDADRFLALNGDSFFAIDPANVLDAITLEVPVAIALAELPNSERFGSVDLLDSGMVGGFAEKSVVKRAGLVNAGVYAFHRAAFEAVPLGEASSLENDVFPRLVSEGCVRGLLFDAYFVDIGIPETYLALVADPTPLVSAVALITGNTRSEAGGGS